MGFLDMAFLPSRDSFSTTFLNCGRSESLGTTTCLKLWLAVSKGMLPVKYICPNEASFYVSCISWR